MRSCRSVVIVAIGAGALLSAVVPARSGSDPEPTSEAASLTRVFYLRGIRASEAIALLRSRAQVRRIAEIRDLDVVIVRDDADRVDRSESVLRERDGVARIVNPREPASHDLSDGGRVALRLFRIEGIDERGVVAVLESIYGMREVTDLGEANGLSVRAPRPDLDAAEELLRGLGVLAQVTDSASR